MDPSSREFQSTHPSGVRPTSFYLYGTADGFQSTHPSGVRLGWITPNVLSKNFNPRTPVGCDLASSTFKSLTPLFQSTHPSGVRLFVVGYHRTRYTFQSTHPSGVRPSQPSTVRSNHHISIHAPQWGATWERIPDRHPIAISIHAPQWGATRVDVDLILDQEFQSTHPSGVRPSCRSCSWESCYFNPRTPVGCDVRRTENGKQIAISIHAPQWGATSARPERSVRRPISIHAPQWGATAVEYAIGDTVRPFQSTHPSGVRLRRIEMTSAPSFLFQSTHPSGVRPVRLPVCRIHAKFQSTHPSGVRRELFVRVFDAVYFNPRTPVGCDPHLVRDP